MKLPQIAPGVRTALQLGASVALLAFLISRLDWERSLALIRSADPLLLLAVIAIQSADRVLMALKWYQLLCVLDTRLGRWGAIRVYYESTFIGFALPLGGLGPDIVRFVRLRSLGISPHITLSSMVMERLNGLVATLALLTAGFAVLAGLASHPALQKFAIVASVGAGVTGVIACGLIFHRASGRALLRLLDRRTSTASARVAKYAEGIRAYAAQRARLAANLGLSILEQLVSVFTLWVGSHALDAPLPWIVCLAVAPVSVIIQRLPLAYAGLGLREGSTAALLVALGYDYSTALILLMTLFVMFCITLLPGAIILAASGRPRLDASRERAPADQVLRADRPLPPEP